MWQVQKHESQKDNKHVVETISLPISNKLKFYSNFISSQSEVLWQESKTQQS